MVFIPPVIDIITVRISGDQRVPGSNVIQNHDAIQHTIPVAIAIGGFISAHRQRDVPQIDLVFFAENEAGLYLAGAVTKTQWSDNLFRCSLVGDHDQAEADPRR